MSHTAAGEDPDLPQRDIWDVLKPLGYKTGLAGKNHSYLKPSKLNFWRPYSHGGGWKAANAPKEVHQYDTWLNRLNHAVHKQPAPFPLEAQLPYRIVSDAIEFMEGAGSQPFALWVSFPEPHNPYQCPRPYFNMLPPESVPARGCGPEVLPKKGFKWELLRRLQEETYPGYDNHWQLTKSIYLGMVRLIDDQLSRLMRAIESGPHRDNTIVVFMSDHGDFMTDYGLMRKGVENPECLIRIPMVFWGRMLKGGQPHHPAQVSISDVFPTICEAAGIPIPRGAQGRSLWPLLSGGEYPRDEFRSTYAEVGFGGLFYGPNDPIDFNTCRIPGPPGAQASFDELNSYTQSGYLRTVRMGNWKLSFDMMGRGQLYNLAADPYELTNVYGDARYTREQARMVEELLTWSIRVEDNLPVARYRAKWAKRNWYAT